MSGLLDGLAMCQEHDCPMIAVEIRGERYYACVLEHVDQHLGGKQVRDVEQRAGVTYLRFADGHQLPLYCSCCGEPLGLADADQFRQNIVGTYLVALAYAPAEGEEPEALSFIFATDAEAEPERADREPLPLHLNSARQIGCPSSERGRSQPQPARPRRRRRRS